MNRITSEKQAQIARLLREGCPLRHVALVVGCNRKTVAVWRSRLGLGGGGCVGVAALARRLGVKNRLIWDLLPMLVKPSYCGGRRRWSEVQVRRMEQFLSAYRALFPRWRRAYVLLVRAGRHADIKRICDLLNEGREVEWVAEVVGVLPDWVRAVAEVVSLRQRWICPPLDETAGKEVFGRRG